MQKILVIDDDQDFQLATRVVLEKNDFEVESAFNPDEGIRKVQSEKPDLIILDVILSEGYEGFEVARKIREDLKMRELPILLLSAVHEVKKVPYRFAPHEQWLPVDYFYDKPIKPEVLVSRIKELLNIDS
jgi:DNA-binding response OmpR family regulator